MAEQDDDISSRRVRAVRRRSSKSQSVTTSHKNSAVKMHSNQKNINTDLMEKNRSDEKITNLNESDILLTNFDFDDLNHLDIEDYVVSSPRSKRNRISTDLKEVLISRVKCKVEKDKSNIDDLKETNNPDGTAVKSENPPPDYFFSDDEKDLFDSDDESRLIDPVYEETLHKTDQISDNSRSVRKTQKDFLKKQSPNLLNHASVTNELEKPVDYSPETNTAFNRSLKTTKHLDTSANVTPQSRQTLRKPSSAFSSLKDRLKHRLLANSATKSPQLNIEEEVKKAALERAHFDASQIRKEGNEMDIGPFYGLPKKVQEIYETTRGISKLYDWQDECLKLPAVVNRQNLIYTLPTGGGKTLVAEILIMRELLCQKRDALLILPFVSIVQEKVQVMSELATELNFLVEEYAGAKGRLPPIKRRQKNSLYIATIEKGHSLINSLIESERISSLGLVVVDELHMLGEGGSRGASLEATLLKLQAVKAETQIIGMSATLNNLNDLEKFLSAELYCNDFRPVSLQEYVKMESNIYAVNNKALHPDDRLQHERVITFPYSSDMLQQDPDHLLGLVTEIIPDNSCLVFCPTKKNCENVATMLCRLMSKQQRHLLNVKKAERRALLQELHQDGAGQICPVLEFTVHFGIAYHHSGLTGDERRLIENAYSDGVLCLLTCTSTLAAGVNLPAKRVILRSPYVGAELIKYSQYKQMCGRAGRAGLDSSGESILIVKKEDRMKVKALLAGPKDSCHSSMMYNEGKGIRNFLLSAVGLKLVSDVSSAFEILRKSLLKIQESTLSVDVETEARAALQYLVDKKLVAQVKCEVEVEGETRYSLKITSLGKATFKGSIDHTHSDQLYQDLLQAEESLNLASHLHLLYLVTPYDAAYMVTPDWTIYYDQYCKLSESEMKAATIIGVPESYLGLKAAGRHSKKKVSELTIRRFYLTLMLWNLWNQKSIWEVAHRFSQTRGFLQNLLSQASAFASCVTHFCQELEEFWAYQDLLSNFVKRLGYCVSAEILPLMEVPGIKVARAKQLITAGFTTVAHLASAEAKVLTSKVEHLSTRQATQIICAAKNLLEEKTAALMEEMESLVVVPVTEIVTEESILAG